MIYTYQLGSYDPMCDLVAFSLINFLSGWSIYWCEWCFQLTQYYCVSVNVLFYTCKHLPYILRWSYVWCTYIYNVIYSSWVDTVTIMLCPSLSCVMIFTLKSISSYTSIAISTYFFYFHLLGMSFSSPLLSVLMCP